MKLLVAFVHLEDLAAATEALRRANFRFTVLQSTSGLLSEPSRTFLVGLGEDRLEECLDVFREHCSGRHVGAPGSLLEGLSIAPDEFAAHHTPVMVEVGGAVAFLLDAEQVL